MGVPEDRANTEVFAMSLPSGVQAVWDLAKAQHETTLTRERICINGLWRWQPADVASAEVPTEHWGYFKVPGSWPGISNYMQKDSQTVHAHPAWKGRRLSEISAAWYEREVSIPAHWTGRRISLNIDTLNSYAQAYINGQPAGVCRFPGGEVGLTTLCRPGQTYRLSLHVLAMPLQGVMRSYTDTAAARDVKGTVARRGLCGDVYLVSTPRDARIADLKVDTSVRKKQFSLTTTLQKLTTGAQYTLKARVLEHGQDLIEFTSRIFQSTDLQDGRITLTHPWIPDRLWDIHTPENTYEVEVTLRKRSGKVLDVHAPLRFGFREFWIDGRDFYLNGTRIFLCAVPLDNAQVGAALATYEAACESLKRLQSFGINLVYTHNYGCAPGSHLGFTEILRAADDVGMLVAFSQPHFSHYDWQGPEAEQNNGYARHAQAYVRAAQNHPSVVMYAMSHNATGYSEDMNPHMIDGIQDARDTWALRNAQRAQRAEAIVYHLDPARLVYHHASGNLGILHAINFYPNFVPIQELSDWFEHWATAGVKPVFTCEYGAPFSWDWTMYRGWYKGEREFGSARVPWEFCLAEWNAQFFGDSAYQIGAQEKANLRWEAKKFQANAVWQRWDYPHRVGAKDFDERYPVFARYLSANWRAFRTWGVSAISPWEYGHFWRLRPGIDKQGKELSTDWDNLQRPGFSPDYVDQQYERMDLAFERSDWQATPAAEALIRNNRPLLAYLAGKPGQFTEKGHNVRPGETVEKQIIVINNSRETVTCAARWSLNLPQALTGSHALTVEAGQQTRWPLRFELPVTLAPGPYELSATIRFSNDEIQQDRLTLDVLVPHAPRRSIETDVALFDPAGETTRQLDQWGMRYQAVSAKDDVSAHDLLIVGKSALTVDGAAPDISGVRRGLKVIVFEQGPKVLEQRLGFRVQAYGLRRVFPRVPDHPILAGIQGAYLHNWRGAATLLPPRLSYELRPRYGPTVSWCDIPVPRAWRCGNRGNVASVLIEKPACGDFLPILDGGYSLQYSPLLMYREGRGMVVFCQIDVTGRTEQDPAAEKLLLNLLEYVSNWRPTPPRQAVYAGEAAGRQHFENAGLPLTSYTGDALSPHDVLIISPREKTALVGGAVSLANWLEKGGRILALGLDQDDINTWLPEKVVTTQEEHISAYFEPFETASLLAGVSPAEIHNRDPRELPLVSAGARIVGNGVLALGGKGQIVFCQLVPWQFNDHGRLNVKRTYRRVSFLVSRVLGNLGVAGSTPLLARFHQPVLDPAQEKRWSQGLYLDQPQEWDDPYRFFRW